MPRRHHGAACHDLLGLPRRHLVSKAPHQIHSPFDREVHRVGQVGEIDHLLLKEQMRRPIRRREGVWSEPEGDVELRWLLVYEVLTDRSLRRGGRESEPLIPRKREEGLTDRDRGVGVIQVIALKGSQRLGDVYVPSWL